MQTLDAAHPLGCHHITAVAFDVVAANAKGNANAGGRVRAERAASAGFGGEVRLWQRRETEAKWSPLGEGFLEPPRGKAGKGKAGEETTWSARSTKNRVDVWALALSADGRYLAATTHDGRVPVWDLGDPEAEEVPTPEKIREYETAAGGAGTAAGPGSFGLCVALSADGRWTAVGCVDGRVYVFDNDKGRLMHSLSGRHPVTVHQEKGTSSAKTANANRSHQAHPCSGILARLHASRVCRRRWRHCTVRHEVACGARRQPGTVDWRVGWPGLLGDFDNANSKCLDHVARLVRLWRVPPLRSHGRPRARLVRRAPCLRCYTRRDRRSPVGREMGHAVTLITDTRRR